MRHDHVLFHGNLVAAAGRAAAAAAAAVAAVLAVHVAATMLGNALLVHAGMAMVALLTYSTARQLWCSWPAATLWEKYALRISRHKTSKYLNSDDDAWECLQEWVLYRLLTY